MLGPTPLPVEKKKKRDREREKARRSLQKREKAFWGSFRICNWEAHIRVASQMCSEGSKHGGGYKDKDIPEKLQGCFRAGSGASRL